MQTPRFGLGQPLAPPLAAVGLACTAALLVLAGCKRPGPAESAAPPPPEVRVARPLEREVTEWDEFTGRLEPVKAVEVRARVSGYLNSIHFKDGQEVRAGDLLFVIDPRPYQAEADGAAAQLRRAQAQRGLAEQNFRRAEALLRGRTISAEQFDARRNEFEIAAADVGAAEAADAAARLNLEFTQIRAPISGRISRRYVDEGNFITGGSANATLLTTIVPFNPLYAEFDVDEATVLKYTRLGLAGQRRTSRDNANPVRIALSDERQPSHDGVMSFVDNRLDETTGTLRGRATVDNTRGLLTPGLFVRVLLKGRGPFRTLLLPDEAIGTDQARKFVMIVLGDNVAQRRFVTTGRLYDGLREITDGISANDRIVVAGVLRVRPGAPVKPIEVNLADAVRP